MHVRHGSEFLRFAAVAAGLLAGASLATAQQAAPAPQPSTPAPSIPLQTYAAPDGSASAGVPAGWKVTKAAYAVIQMSGPNGEAIGLGEGIFVKDGPYQPGQKANGPISMTMPNQATLAQKVTMVWQQAAAAAGDPTDRVSVTSATPIPLGSVAQCGIFLGSQTSSKGATNWEMRICSLPIDTNGIYKLFWLDAVIPASLAAQERATAEAVLSSYRPSLATLEQTLKPTTPPLPPMGWTAPGGSSGDSSTIYAEQQAQQTSDCMDEGVIRGEPEWQLPPYCR
jgi:hypothetical protein